MVQQQQQQQPSDNRNADDFEDVNANAEEGEEGEDEDDNDPRTKNVMKSFTKWIIFMMAALVVFVAAFVPLALYATKVEIIEEETEKTLDSQAGVSSE